MSVNSTPRAWALSNMAAIRATGAATAIQVRLQPFSAKVSRTGNIKRANHSAETIQDGKFQDTVGRAPQA